MRRPAWLARPGLARPRQRLGSKPMAAKRSRRRHPFPRTLRGRLIAGLVALLAVACATVGMVTYLAVQGALTRELDGELSTATNLAYNCWNHQIDTQQGGDNAPGQGASPPAGSADGTGTSPLPTHLNDCPGLGEKTFVAVVWHGQ